MRAVSSPADSDPIDSTDVAALRRETLRARDAAHGAQARSEVLARRIDELEAELHALGAHAETLQTRLDRSPIHQARRVVGRLRRIVGRSR